MTNTDLENIEFVDITIDNWEKCISLTVSEEQRSLVAPNVYSLAESKFETDMQPIGICVNDVMIGFIMYAKDATANKVWIIRFMIDKSYQRKGYGSLSLQKLITILNQKYVDSDIYLCVEPENTVAKKLYSNYKFIPTGEIWGRELIYKRLYTAEL